MDELSKVCETVVQMSRLLLSGKPDEAVRYLQRKAFVNRKSTLMVWMDGVERDDDAQTIPYAMVITIIAPKTPDIYERVLQRYATKIRPIMEQEIQVPVEV